MAIRFEGVIEVVANATTVASIQRSSLGGVLVSLAVLLTCCLVFKDDLLHDWLQLHNQSDVIHVCVYLSNMHVGPI